MGKIIDLRAATIGCGRMGAFGSETVSEYAPSFWMPISHLAAIRDIEGITSVACSDISQERRLEAKQQFNIARDYADALEMLSKEQLDILTIATRTPAKANLIEAAIDAGVRAIHVEKPLCCSVAELRLLSKIIRTSGVLITFGCLRRYLPPYFFARNYVKSKRFGDIVEINIEMGNAPLMWSLVHGLDLLLYYSYPAKPILVQAWFEKIESDNRAYLTVKNDPKLISATVIFDNGVSGRIGRTSGDNVTISSSLSRIEVFADGKQVFRSESIEKRPYQTRSEMDWSQSYGQVIYGGSAAPLHLLKSSLGGCEIALKTVGEASEAMLQGQHLIFDMLWSHLQDGKVVNCGQYPEALVIQGITDGRPA